MPSRILVTVILAVLVSPSLFAATRFVRGGSGLLGTYAIIERNGVEYRTNEVPSKVNQRLWAELSDADRRAVIGVYDWRIGRRIDDFGQVTSDEMAAWIDAAQGWTAAAEALKAKHANKEFPELAARFGNLLVLPTFACNNADVMNSAEYKEATRLKKEVQYDYELGKALYLSLINAKWDQIGVAVKAISEDLIKIIVDNFMTGIITNGASKTSQLVGQVLDPVKDAIRDIVLGRMTLGSTPPTATKLIAMINAMIVDMENAANGQNDKVQTKLSRLEELAGSIRQRCAERTQAKKDEALLVRGAMLARTERTPIAFDPPVFAPRNPGGTAEEQRIDVGVQAHAWLKTNVVNPMATRATTKKAAVETLVGKYGGLVSLAQWISYPGGQYFADASAAFGDGYYEIMDGLAKVQGWIATDLPAAQSSFQASAAKLLNGSREVDTVLDANLPEIYLLDARNRAMDVYEVQLGYRPSFVNSFTGLRDFNAAIDIAATTDLTAEDLATEYTDREALASELSRNLPKGVSKRREWMAEQAAKYGNLRFNWENSISYVIALNRQIDRLHSGPYFKRAEYPTTCFEDLCIYRYSVDVAGINASIAANGTRQGRVTARAAAVRELTRLRNEEIRLINLLEIAQKSHMADASEMDNFFSALYTRYADSGEALADFANAGFPLRTKDQLYTALVPDITYYYLGGWIRNSSRLVSGLGGALPLVSGKIYEYYELLDLYNSMKVNRSSYLGMSLDAFNAFMTASTRKIETNGTYYSAFTAAGVYGVEWPCWQLTMKTQRRLEELNSQYRGYGILSPVAWDVEGTVRTASGSAAVTGPIASDAISGIGVPEVDVVLDGYLTESAKSDSQGRFRFTWIGSGGFYATATGGNYQIDQPTNVVTVTNTDTTTAFTARETSASGYFVTGQVTDPSGLPLQGIAVNLMSQGAELQHSTAADGTFTFEAVPAGDIQLRPSSASLVFTPPILTASVSASLGGQYFVAAPGTVDPGLSVAVAGGGAGTVTGSGINCPPVCYSSYPEATDVSLSATPAIGSRFTGWFGRCSGLESCRVTVVEVLLVSARFETSEGSDTLPPQVTTFSIPATSSSLQVSLNFAARDDVGVTGYLATIDPTLPSAADPRWTPTPPATFTFARLGQWTLYGFAKDAAGNVGSTVPATVTIPFAAGAPAGVWATATSTSRVAVSWSAVSGASTYAIERRAVGSSFQLIGNTSATSFADLGAAGSTAYLYRVSAGAYGVYSTPSTPDLATTVAFTDAPLMAGAPIRAAHLAQLRSAIAAARQLAGLGVYPFTDSALAGVPIRAVHVTEMRTALEQACSLLGLPGYAYLDGSLAGTFVKAAHFQQLRDRLQ